MVMTKEECESLKEHGYEWVTQYRKKDGTEIRSFCRHTSVGKKEKGYSEEWRLYKGDEKPTPEEAYESLKKEVSKSYGYPAQETSEDIFYNDQMDREHEPEWGMRKVRRGKTVPFGTGLNLPPRKNVFTRSLYMEGSLEKKGRKRYVAYGEMSDTRDSDNL